jgi:hypothetical protein
MTTVPNTIPVVNYDKNLQANRTLLMPVGSELGNITPFPERTLCDDTSRRFNKANIWDVAFCNRFFGSNNRIAQMNLAPPSRLCGDDDRELCRPPVPDGVEDSWISPLSGPPDGLYGTVMLSNTSCNECVGWYLPCSAAYDYNFCWWSAQPGGGWSCGNGPFGDSSNVIGGGDVVWDDVLSYRDFSQCCAWGGGCGPTNPETPDDGDTGGNEGEGGSSE